MSNEILPENSGINPEENNLEKEKPTEVGGWLLLFQIVVVLELIISFFLIFFNYKDQIVAFSFAVHIIIDFWLAYVVEKREKRGPQLIINILIFTMVFRVIFHFIYMNQNGLRFSDEVISFFLVFLFSVLPPLLWCRYFKQSKRVKYTFTK